MSHSQIAFVLRRKYPNSPIIILADNDRHLEHNKGVQAATAARDRLCTNCTIAIPNLNGFSASSDYSDWNDLLREKGHQEVRDILTKIIRS